MGDDYMQWERFRDARIEFNKNEFETQDEVAAAIGVSKSLVEDTERETVQRDFRSSTLKKFAVHYGVSIDWLLGLTEDDPINPEIRAACEVTGLSEAAIRNIQKETVEDTTRLALEVLLCSDSDMLHDLCKTVYRAVAGYFLNSQIEPLLDSFPSEYKEKFSKILDCWDGIVLDPKEALRYNSFEAGNILSEIVDHSEKTAIKKYNEIFGKKRNRR